MKKTAIVLILAALVLPIGLSAQGYRDRDRRDHGGRDFEERRGRVSAIIADCERRTDELKVAVRRALDRSPLNGSQREDELNRDAAVLERALNRLRESWNADRDFERSRRNLGVALSAGRDINRTLGRHRLGGQLRREWDIVKGELNRLAEIFQEPKIRWD
jgi:hypothetical protein